jgi:solute carrier family 35 protein F5
LTPRFFRYLKQKGIRGFRNDAALHWNEYRQGPPKRSAAEVEDEESDERLLSGYSDLEPVTKGVEKLNFRETAVISLEFSMLWFLANYFSSACLQFTSVASTTILSSTSSMWTLIFCAMLRIEPFTMRKLVGVGASLAGVVLISTVDMSGQNDENTGSFPHKTTAQIAIGDVMAFISALIYGVYVTVMKQRVGNEDKVDMPLFFGMVGVFNLLLLWPVFIILHFTGLEPVRDLRKLFNWTID